MIDHEVIADCRCGIGEGPLWHRTERRLYWLDIPAGCIYRYDPSKGSHEIVHEGGVVGGFTIQADGTLLLFMARGAVAVWGDGMRRKTIVESVPELWDSRFNDVVTDPVGRVICGTMPTPTRGAMLYRLDLDGSLTCLLS
ncbi:MAG: SMP-30/gluconolactonase/LRE family protein, partial [Dehalococcoidales bacterium]|nr:SMP-30/gluconolactonase/LRE family protein [Dehalococcoidales bacterium]